MSYCPECGYSQINNWAMEHGPNHRPSCSVGRRIRKQAELEHGPYPPRESAFESQVRLAQERLSRQLLDLKHRADASDNPLIPPPEL